MLGTVSFVFLKLVTKQITKLTLGRAVSGVIPFTVFNRVVSRVEKTQPDCPENNVLLVIASFHENSALDATRNGILRGSRGEKGPACLSNGAAIGIVFDTVRSLTQAPKHTLMPSSRVAGSHAPVGDPSVPPSANNCSMNSGKGELANDPAKPLYSKCIRLRGRVVPAGEEESSSATRVLLSFQRVGQYGFVQCSLKQMRLVQRVRGSASVPLLVPQFRQNLCRVDIPPPEFIISLSEVKVEGAIIPATPERPDIRLRGGVHSLFELSSHLAKVRGRGEANPDSSRQ